MNKFFYEDLLDDALEMVHQGKSYAEIKNFVQSKTGNPEKIKDIMWHVNDEILRDARQSKPKDNKTIIVTLGIILIAVIPGLYTYFFYNKKLLFIPILIIYAFYKLNKMFRSKSGEKTDTYQTGKFKRRY